MREAIISGALIGAAAGAAVGAPHGDGLYAGVGAVAGTVLGAAVEALSERDRIPGRPKPIWHRWGMAVWLAAALGGLIDLAAGPFMPSPSLSPSAS